MYIDENSRVLKHQLPMHQVIVKLTIFL